MTDHNQLPAKVVIAAQCSADVAAKIAHALARDLCGVIHGDSTRPVMRNATIRPRPRASMSSTPDGKHIDSIEVGWVFGPVMRRWIVLGDDRARAASSQP